MTCPACGGKTSVTCTRATCESIRRYRRCKECSYRFSTLELDLDLYKNINKSHKKGD